MKLTKFSFLMLGILIPSLIGCNNGEPSMKVTEIEPYLYEVETYTKLDYDYADAFYASENDNWSGGGCSAITKMIGNKRVIGRNMDLNISENCAYVVRTKVPGKYETMGLQYTFRDVSPKYNEVKAHGISSKWSKLLPFYQDDVMNDAGLHIEINMRHGEYSAQGFNLFAVESTNPNGARRVHMFELPIYIAQNCATVEDAKEYVNSLDIYSKDFYWNYCFIIADADGNASLLEFSSNPLNDTKIYWFDEDKLLNDDYDFSYFDDYPGFEGLEYNAIAQTNFFINKYAYLFQDTKSGFGRMKTMQMGIKNDKSETIVKGIGDVNSKADMYQLMKTISYGHFYEDFEVCISQYFDPRSEQLGELGFLNSAFCMNDKYKAEFAILQNAYVLPIRQMTREQKRAENKYWESTFTEVVDIEEKTIFVRFYENNDMIYKLSFDGFIKSSENDI